MPEQSTKLVLCVKCSYSGTKQTIILARAGTEIYSFSKHVLGAYDAPGTVRGTRAVLINKRDDK